MREAWPPGRKFFLAAVRVWNRDPTQIEVLLEVKEGTPLNDKSVARLGSISLMSSPVISITTGSQGAQRLRAGQAIASQESVSMDDMMRKLAGIADNAADLMTQVQGELKELSGQAQTLLASLNEATGPANRKQIGEILQRVNALVAQQVAMLGLDPALANGPLYGELLPALTLNSGIFQTNQRALVLSETPGAPAAVAVPYQSQAYSLGLAASYDVFTGGRRTAVAP